MRATEARRLALLIILDEALRSLDVSDEWERHPETDVAFTRADKLKVRTEAELFLRQLNKRVSK